MNLVFTIGYEGTDIERFIETLKIVGVKVLADVRAVALSRKMLEEKIAEPDQKRLQTEFVEKIQVVRQVLL